MLIFEQGLNSAAHTNGTNPPKKINITIQSSFYGLKTSKFELYVEVRSFISTVMNSSFLQGPVLSSAGSCDSEDKADLKLNYNLFYLYNNIILILYLQRSFFLKYLGPIILPHVSLLKQNSLLCSFQMKVKLQTPSPLYQK